MHNVSQGKKEKDEVAQWKRRIDLTVFCHCMCNGECVDGGASSGHLMDGKLMARGYDAEKLIV